MCVRGGCVIHRCQNKNPRNVNDVMHRKRARRILGDLKKSVVENYTPNGKGRLLGLAKARRICALRTPHVMGGADGKVIIERLCISLPYVEKPFNSKVIKSFVPELRSRKCFSCFRIPMFYVIIHKRYEHSMYISHIHVWLCYIYIYIYICVCVCIYIYIYIHSFT